MGHRADPVLADRLPQAQPPLRTTPPQLPGLSRPRRRPLLLQATRSTHHIGHGLKPRAAGFSTVGVSTTRLSGTGLFAAGVSARGIAAAKAGDGPVDCDEIKVLDGYMGRKRLGSDGRYHLKEGDTEIQIDDPKNLADTITDFDLVRGGVLWENKTVTARKLTQAQLQKWVDKHAGKKIAGYKRARPILAGYEDAPIGIRFEDPAILDINPGLKDLVLQRMKN